MTAGVQTPPARTASFAGDLVLAAVTAVLKSFLENGLVDRGVAANVGADALVSALPPDRIEVGAEERAQLNLFLYQIRPRGMDYLPHSAPDGKDQWLSTAPAFELHYLISAYGGEDLQPELLLGFVIEALGATPVLEGVNIGPALEAAGHGKPMVPGVAAIRSTGLADRIRQIRLSHQALTPDEMFNIWSTLQATYRPSVVYKASVYVSRAEGP